MASASQAQNEEDASGAQQTREWLDRMVAAVRGLSYEGTFVYLHGNRLESLRISHVVQDGQVRERMISLNGPPRVVNRDQDNVICILPDAKSVSMDKRRSLSGIPLISSFSSEHLAKHYALHFLGDARIAMRDSVVVGIIPRDELRYGYRLYLDRATALPLKSDLMGESADPIEQVMFTELVLNPDGVRAKEEPASRTNAKDAPMAADHVSGDPAATKDNAKSSTRWSFSGLPIGFYLQTHGSWSPNGERSAEHFVLTDGLASLSVYVEEHPSGASRGALQGTSNLGAVNAFGEHVSGYQVTAVGKVPEKTVQDVVQSIRLAAGSPSQ